MDRGLKRKQLNRLWQIAHSKRLLKRKRHNSKEHPRGKALPKEYQQHRGHFVTAPHELGLIGDYRDQTLTFYKEVLHVILSCTVREHVYFNFENITKITNDAIMYIIALINNVQRVKAYQIEIAGNMPKDTDAREVIEKSGFYRYVSSPGHRMEYRETGNIQITGGREADGVLAGQMCDFVHRVCNKNINDTKRLFPMIMELMTNTRQHAYSPKSVMDNKWYIFAESFPDGVHFVFLDTGDGIPGTIQKKILERIIDKIPLANDTLADAKYISSALRGEFRTETKKEYRGKGLPEVYNDSCKGTISELAIISGLGMCRVGHDCKIEEIPLKSEFVGTMFSWKFNK